MLFLNHIKSIGALLMKAEQTNQSNALPPRRIRDVALELGIDPEILLPHGHYIAKIPLDELKQSDNN
jgi:formyltetrahydrofolate synthetase